ncbi:MAG: tyrosine--tRNA ligase [Verrucomicrobiales bacterium]|nr:tyrosine--tRNA ligase [Verrucomicrobiales bacterium]MCP5527371.1 tyrosine--tRNA ligase [Verrucomicrobiales bacterium]
MDILAELKWRGLLADCTDAPALAERLARGPVTLYCGFDPTADSLHVGNLVPLLALRRFQLAGHRPIALAGGATGSIGDPSGKTQERQLLTPETIRHNIAAVKQQLARLLDFETTVNPARVLDNADWLGGMGYLEFLRDVGKHFTVNMMVAKESVRSRMEDREVGISYTEFSYMLLQAFDFYHLRRESECELQIGGSDQWGNITAGLDLARRKLNATVFGLTLPLITNADGTKFGKTEAGAVWLDPQRTSVYRFYQFWIRTDDRDVLRYLKFFTLLPAETIAGLEAQHAERPEGRVAHQALATAVTEMIHGEAACREAVRASQILFGGDLEGISESTFNEIVGEVPTAAIERARLSPEGLPLLDLLVDAGLCPSKGQARKDVQGGGIYVNNRREADPQRRVPSAEWLFDKHLLLRKGKRNYAVLTAV